MKHGVERSTEMTKGFKIDQLIGESWNNAVANVITVLNHGRMEGDKLFYQRDRFFVEDTAMELGIRFTEDGDIIR